MNKTMSGLLAGSLVLIAGNAYSQANVLGPLERVYQVLSTDLTKRFVGRAVNAYYPLDENRPGAEPLIVVNPLQYRFFSRFCDSTSLHVWAWYADKNQKNPDVPPKVFLEIYFCDDQLVDAHLTRFFEGGAADKSILTGLVKTRDIFL